MRRAWTRRCALLALAPAAVALAAATPGHPAAGGTLAPPVVPVGVVARPAAPAAPPVPRHETGSTHTVVGGETLSHLAVRYGVSVDALAAANGLRDPNLIRQGSTLTIPGAGAAASPGAAEVPAGAADPSGLPARLQASPDRLAYLPTFDHWAAANGIPADLLKAMTWLESGWQNDRVSSTGAVGIGQLMPDTVEFMELLIGQDLDPSVVDDNIRMSARFLRWLLARYGAPEPALAAYYQGPASVERQGTLPETDTYVADVLALRDRF